MFILYPLFSGNFSMRTIFLIHSHIYAQFLVFSTLGTLTEPCLHMYPLVSTPAGRPATQSLQLMRRADTAAASHSSTARNHTSWWRRWISLDPMYLGYSLRRGRDGGTSWVCTSPPRTRRRWSG